MRLPLQVHTTQRASLVIERDVALANRRIDAVLPKGRFTERPGKKTSLISQPGRLDDEERIDFCWLDVQEVSPPRARRRQVKARSSYATFTSGSGMMNFPPSSRYDCC